MTDTERINYLEELVEKGSCPALVNDDAGRWALVSDGIQNCPDLDQPTDIHTTFFVEAEKWKPTIREAIDTYMKVRP